MATAIANQPQASSTFPPSLTWSFSVSGTVTGTWEATLWSAPYYEGAYNQLEFVNGPARVTGSTTTGGTIVTYGTPTTSYYYQVRVTGGGITGTVISTPLYFYSPYQGPQGVQGQQGTRGTQGPTGITGPQGQRGIQGLMEINDYTVPNQLLTSASDSVHVNPNPNLTFNGTVLALTGNMNTSGSIATAAGFTGPTVSTSGLIYSGGFTGPAASTINGIGIDPLTKNMSGVGTLNTSGYIATSAGFTGLSFSATNFVTAAGGFTGPSSGTINGISIGLTNQGMTGVSSINGIVFGAGTSSATQTISALGKIYSGGFTGPAASTINGIGIDPVTKNMSGVGTLNTSGYIATSAGFTGSTVSTSGLISSGGNITAVGTISAGSGSSSIGGVTLNNGTVTGFLDGNIAGSSATCRGNAASATNFVGAPDISVGTITASSGSSTIGGVTLNTGTLKHSTAQTTLTVSAPSGAATASAIDTLTVEAGVGTVTAGNAIKTTGKVNTGALTATSLTSTGGLAAGGAITGVTTITNNGDTTAITSIGTSAMPVTNIYGALTGNVTGTCSGTSGGLAGIPNITVGTIGSGIITAPSINNGASTFTVTGTTSATLDTLTVGIPTGASPTGNAIKTTGKVNTGALTATSLTSTGGLAAGGAITGVTTITNNGDTTAITSIGTSAMPVTNIYGALTGSCSGTSGGLAGIPNIIVGTIGSGKLIITEATGTVTVSNVANTLPAGAIAGITTGSLTLKHNNDPGQSSIVFPASCNAGSDYGFITYMDDVSNVAGQERSRLLIGAQNDPTNILNSDGVIIQPFGGYVGVGQMKPAAELDVNGNVHIATDPFQTQDPVLYPGQNAQLSVMGRYAYDAATAETVNHIEIGSSRTDTGNHGTVNRYAFATYKNNNGGLDFNINQLKVAASSYSGALTTSTPFTIYRDGNVGINCNAPAYPLDVNGTIRGGQLRGTNLVVSCNIPTDTTAELVSFYSTGTGATTFRLGFGNASVTAAIDALVNSTTNAGALSFKTYAGSGSFLEGLYISPTQNVGIGTSGAAAYKLDVAGTIRATGNLISAGSGNSILLVANGVAVPTVASAASSGMRIQWNVVSPGNGNLEIVAGKGGGAGAINFYAGVADNTAPTNLSFSITASNVEATGFIRAKTTATTSGARAIELNGIFFPSTPVARPGFQVVYYQYSSGYTSSTIFSVPIEIRAGIVLFNFVQDNGNHINIPLMFNSAGVYAVAGTFSGNLSVAASGTGGWTMTNMTSATLSRGSMMYIGSFAG